MDTSNSERNSWTIFLCADVYPLFTSHPSAAPKPSASLFLSHPLAVDQIPKTATALFAPHPLAISHAPSGSEADIYRKLSQLIEEGEDHGRPRILLCLQGGLQTRVSSAAWCVAEIFFQCAQRGEHSSSGYSGTHPPKLSLLPLHIPFLGEYFKKTCQTMADALDSKGRPYRHLPNSVRRSDVLSPLQTSLVDAKMDGSPPSESTLLRVWKREFGNARNPKITDYGVCSVCLELRYQRVACTTEDAINEWKRKNTLPMNCFIRMNASFVSPEWTRQRITRPK